jgi:hypothetical protein
MRETYEAEDELDDAAEDAREAQERRTRQAAARAAAAGGNGQGMYFHQRVYWGELLCSALSTVSYTLCFVGS